MTEREIEARIRSAVADVVGEFEDDLFVITIRITRGWGDIKNVVIHASARDPVIRDQAAEKLRRAVADALPGRRSRVTMTWSRRDGRPRRSPN